MSITLEYATTLANYGDRLRSGGVAAGRASGENPLDAPPRGQRLTSERFADYADAYREFYDTADRHDLDRIGNATSDIDIVLGNPAGRSYTLPWFFSWLRRENRAPFDTRPQYTPTAITYTTVTTPEPATVIPANPHIDHVALATAGREGRASTQGVRLITPADMAPYATLADEFYADRTYHGYRSALRRRRLTPIAGGYLLVTEPRRRPGWMPMFFYWMQVGQRGPFAPVTTDTPAAGVLPNSPMPAATVLPSSPQAAFGTWAAAHDAARAWQHDTDPRLPNELAIDGSYVRNPDGPRPSNYRSPDTVGRYDYSEEMRRGWDADDFTTGSPFAQGFWRDVRDLGYGTPAFTTSAPAVPERVELDWVALSSETYGIRERACRAVTTESLEAYRADIERWIDAGADTHGITRGNLDQMIARPAWYTLSLPAFARWFVANRTPAPVAATAAVPVDMITVDQLATPARLRDAERIAERMEPWRKTLIRWINEVGLYDAGMEEGWLTASLDELPHSSMARIMQEPHRMAATLPRFARWLYAHSQTAPDPAEPAAVPSGDSIIPIGPEHPGWAAFWESARTAAVGAGYNSYYETLARAFNVLPSRTRQRIRMTVEMDVEVASENARPDYVSWEVADQARRMLRAGTYTEIEHTVRSTTPVR